MWKYSLENWDINLDLGNKILGIKTRHDKKGENIQVKIEITKGEHYAMRVAIHKELDTEKMVLLMEKRGRCDKL